MRSHAYDFLRSYPAGDFLALLVSHIPVPYENLTNSYGLSGSSYRGKQRPEKREEQETELVLRNTSKVTAGGKPTSSRARLIRRISEVDPVRCKRCRIQMHL